MMERYTDKLYQALDTELALLGPFEAGGSQLKEAITLCKKAMIKLKNFIAGYAFADAAEEVRFFKTIKPRFYSRYIYLISVYNFVIQRPPGSEEVIRGYIYEQLADVKRFFDHNQAFYQYYRSGMTQLDQIYYTRGGFDVHAELEDFEEDEQYSTSHDYKLSKIMANEKFQDHLNLELARTGSEHRYPTADGPVFPFQHPAWTASQTDAVELIYALKVSGSVNNGNIEISTLVSIFEFVFQTELKEYYHKFTDITRRKKEMSLFLNKLRDGLLRWVDDKVGA